MRHDIYKRKHPTLDTEQTIERVEFDSISEFMVDCVAPPVHGCGIDSEASEATRNWDLSAGFDGALTIGAEGWPEGRKKLAKYATSMTDKILREVEAEDWAVCEESPAWDVGAMMSSPEYCIRPMLRKGMQRVVRVGLNVCASASVEAEAMVKRAAPVVALIETLERAGVGVEVVVEWSSGRDAVLFSASVLVKKAGEPLNYEMVAAYVAHPAVSRRLFFRQMEHSEHPSNKEETRGSYGAPWSEDLISSADIAVASKFGHMSEEEAEHWMLEQLEKFGVTTRKESHV